MFVEEIVRETQPHGANWSDCEIVSIAGVERGPEVLSEADAGNTLLNPDEGLGPLHVFFPPANNTVSLLGVGNSQK